jgi:hypothetical protein
LYPRLHSSLTYILKDIEREEKLQDKVKLTQQFVKAVLEEHLFNEEIYASMKSTSKFKFLHIGLNLWKLVVQSIQTWDSKLKARE